MKPFHARRSAFPALARTYPALLATAAGLVASPSSSPVAPRIRDALVLRLVAGRKAAAHPCKPDPVDALP